MLTKKRRFVMTYRWLFGLLTFTAIGFQFSVASRNPGFNPLNFFSFFTNPSNILAAAVFLYGAVRPPKPALDQWRGAAVLCMTMTGAVFTLLLSRLDVLVLPAVNVVVHYLMPAAVLADWLVDPPQTKLALRQGLRWLGIPVAYVIYILVRGSLIHWYPYPFLSPAVNGYGHVAIYCAGISIAFVIATWGLVALGDAVRRNPAQSA